MTLRSGIPARRPHRGLYNICWEQIAVTMATIIGAARMLLGKVLLLQVLSSGCHTCWVLLKWTIWPNMAPKSSNMAS